MASGNLFYFFDPVMRWHIYPAFCLHNLENDCGWSVYPAGRVTQLFSQQFSRIAVEPEIAIVHRAMNAVEHGSGCSPVVRIRRKG